MIKKLLFFTLSLFIFSAPLYVFAQVTTVGGGTGSTSPSGILNGVTGNLHLQTLKIGTGLTFDGTTLTATGGGGSFPFTPQTYGNSTSSVVAFLVGLISNGSTTISSLSSGLVGNNNGLLYSFASSSLFGYTPLNPTRNINTTFPLQGGGALTSDLTLTNAFSTTSNSGMAQGNLYVGSGGIFQTSASSSLFGFTPASNALTVTLAGTANQITSSNSSAQALTGNVSTTLTLPNHVIFPVDFLASAGSTTNATTTGSQYFTGITASRPLYVDSTGKLTSAGSGTSGNCVNWGANNTLGDAGSACGSGGGSTFPFTPTTYGALAANSTSTLLIDTIGIVAQGTSTIGNGTQTSGLTISGGATTTGNLLVNGTGTFLQDMGLPGAANGNPGFHFTSAGSASSYGASIGIGLDTGFNEVMAVSTAGFRVVPSTGTDLLTILGTGATGARNVGIGSSTPKFLLAVGTNNIGNFGIATSTSGCATFAVTGELYSTGSACGTGGGGTFSFTPTTNFGATANSTSTPIWFTNGLQASTTSQFDAAQFRNGVAIGTTSPYAFLSIGAPLASATTTLFAISSSTLGAGNASIFSVSNTGFIAAGVGTTSPNLFTIDGTTGTTTIANLALGNIIFDTNAGVVNLSNIPIDTNAAIGTMQSQSISIGDTPILTTYAEATGGGGIRNTGVGIGTTSPMAMLTVFATQVASSTNNLLFAIASSTITGATSTLFSINNIGTIKTAITGSTQCLHVDTNGIVTGTGSDCGAGGSTFGNAFSFVQAAPTNYLIPTTTTTGILIAASSTIGNGTPTTGLTISGGATTTGTHTVLGNIAIGNQTTATGVFLTTATTFNAGNRLSVRTSDSTAYGGLDVNYIEVGSGSSRSAFFFDNAAVPFFNFASNGVYGWSDNLAAGGIGSNQTGLSRLSAGKVAIGNGVQGDFGGSLIITTLGLGTTTPFAQLSLIATSTTGTGSPLNLFVIASSTRGTATSSLFSVSNIGATVVQGTSPSIFQVNDGFGTNLLNVNSASTTGPIFAVMATTSKATSCGGLGISCLFSIDQYGHVAASSTLPVLSSCGTSPSLSSDSSDSAGTITVGSVAATACTLTFGVAHTVGTHCVISEQTGSVVNASSYTESLTGFTYSQTGLTSDKLDYICYGQ